MEMKADASDCPEHFQKYSEPLRRLESIIDIKPMFVQDFTTIRDKFPCNHEFYDKVEGIVSKLQRIVKKRMNQMLNLLSL